MADQVLETHLPHRAIHAQTAPALRLSPLWPIMAIAAVLYGSLIPFAMDFHGLSLATALDALRTGFGRSNTEDIITNVLVYVPVGATIVLFGLPRMTGASRTLVLMLVAVLIGAAVSTTAELLQTGISIRVASWSDVALNIGGTFLGGAFGLCAHDWLARGIRRLRVAFRMRPFSILAPALAVGLFCHDLLPFNFVTDTAGLHAAFQRAQWDLTSIRSPYPGQPPFAPLMHQLSAAIWYALLAFLWFRARRESGWRTSHAWLSAAKHGAILACLTELMQLLTLWHVFDLGTLALRFLAVLFGAWCALLITADPNESDPIRPGRKDAQRARRQRRTFGALVLAALLAYQIGAVVLSNLDPGAISPKHLESARVSWIPFESYWHRSFGHAVVDMTSTVVTLATLALTCAILVGRLRRRAAWLLASMATLGTALTVEVLQGCTPPHTADLTGPVLAVISIALAWSLVGLATRAPSPSRIDVTA